MAKYFLKAILVVLVLEWLIWPRPGSTGWLFGDDEEKIRVVATTLELAEFAREIGGDKVSVDALSRGKYDLHFFEPRPSHVLKVKKADILLILGMNADVWIKPLIDASRNPNVRFGQKGYVDCSVGIHPLQVPTRRIQGDQGDVHPFGNPHYWFDLENVKVTINNVYNALARSSTKDAAYFKKNRDIYLTKVEAEFSRLKEMLKPYKNAKIVGYHRSWIYLANYFGLKIVGNLEPLPGIPPSAAHVSKLIKRMKKEGVKILLIEPYYNLSVDFVASNTGAKVLKVANFVGGIPEVNTYLENLRYIITQIVMVLKKEM